MNLYHCPRIRSSAVTSIGGKRRRILFSLFWFSGNWKEQTLPEMGGEAELAIERRDATEIPEHVVLYLKGHATPANHGVLTRAFQAAREDLEKHSRNAGGVILVLRDMETISSSCVGAMLSLSRDLEKTGRRIVLAEVSTAVLQILDMLRLNDVFPVLATEAEAHTELRAD